MEELQKKIQMKACLFLNPLVLVMDRNCHFPHDLVVSGAVSLLAR